MLNQTAHRILVFFISVLFLSSCYTPQSEDQSSDLQVSDNDKIQNEEVAVSINFSGSSRNSSRVSTGSFADIDTILLNVEQVSPRQGFVITDQSLSVSNGGNNATGTLVGLVVGREYNFIAKAHDNNTTLIFKGNTLHRVKSNSEGNSIFISMVTQVQSEQAAIPRITRLLRSDTVDYQNSTNILASVVIAPSAESGVAPELNWRFWEYRTNPSIPCEIGDNQSNKICGAFSPSSGTHSSNDIIVSKDDSVQPSKWNYDISTVYTPSGATNSVAQHKLIFEAKNRQRIGVRQRFFLNVTGPATTNITSNTAPSPMEYSAQRLVWDNDSGKTHFVLDDPSYR